MRVEGRQLRIVYNNASQYLTADNCAVGVKSYGSGVVIKSTAKSGYAILNDAAKAVLFPNAIAKPVKADSRIACGASVKNKNNYCSLEINGTEVHKVLCSDEVGEQDGLTSAAITSATSAATIRYHMHIDNLFVAAACSVGQLTLYFKRYSCAAIASGNGIASSSVSNSEVWDGDSVTFTPVLVQGATWHGWYSDEACTNLVSTDQNYTIIPTSDLTLYAKATHDAILYNCVAIAGTEEIASVSVSDHIVPEGGECTFSARINEGCSFDAWYSDDTYSTIVSSNNPYIATITANTTLYAKAHRNNFSISVGSAEHGTATVSATTVPWGSDITFTFTPEDETWELYGWYSDLTLTQLVSEANPYTFTVTENVTLYPKVGRKMLTITLTTLSPFDGSVHTLLSCDLNSLTSDELIALKRGNLEAISQNKIFDKQTVTSANSIVPKTISIKCPMGYAIGMSASGSNDTVTIFFTSEDVTLTFWPYYMTIPTGNQKYRTVKYNGTCLCSSQGLDGISSTYVPSHVVQGSAAPFEAEVKPGYVFQGWYDNTGALINSNNPANITTPVDNSGASPLKATSLTLYAKAISAIASATGIFLKCNGSWLESKKVYKKVSGTWVEQTNVASLFNGTASGSPTNYVCGGRV